MKTGKRKTRKPSSNDYIPLEVLTQILANLPVKSVLRFRCVCKSWCSIIDDPDFISMHLQLCNTNPFNPDKLIALEGLRSGGLKSGSLLTLRKADTLRKTGHIFKCSRTYDIQGSCNSLILISCYFHTSMRLCNPSIRKALLIPECPFQKWSSYYTSFVLGFALCTKDVKVIAITTQTMQFEIPEMRVVVYTLSDRQWTVRDNGLDINALYFQNLFGPYYFCEGAAHWLGKDPYGDNGKQDYKPTHLASLDFDTESFIFLELPYALDEVNTSILRSLFLLGDSLAFFYISSVSLNIWVLKQNYGKREWTLWFSGPSSSDGFNMFCTRRSRTRVLYRRGDGGSLICGKKSYNISTCHVRLIGKSMSRDVELETYYESLILCKEYGALDIASFPFCEDE